MKAAVLVRTGNANHAFEVREVEKPKLDAFDVLIKVEAFGLNFADVMARNGMYAAAPKIPSILGYDVVGEVVEVAGDEGKHLLGKRVVAMTRFGGYAEYAKTDYRACAIISQEMHAAAATALATQYCTAYYAAFECVSLFKGDRVLLHAAAGGVGTAISQLAKIKGCEVFGLTSSDSKFEYLKKQGVDFPINHTKEDYVSQVFDLTKGQRIDVAFNSVGGSTFKKDAKLLEFGGKQVIYGAAEMAGTKGTIFSKLNLVRKFGFYTPISLMIKSQGVIGINMLQIADHKKLVIKRCLEEVVKLTEYRVVKNDLSTEKGLLNFITKHFGGTKGSGKTVLKQFQEEEMVAIEKLYIHPEDVDGVGDTISLEDTRGMVDSLNKAIEAGTLQHGLFHKHKTDSFSVVKAWVAETDCIIGETEIREGQPLIKVQFHNETAWELRKSGEIAGISIGAKATEIEELTDD